MPGRERLRLEEAEQRPQLMLDHQRMPRAAAGRAEQDRLSGERKRVEQVEQMLEEPAVAALVDRAGQDQRVGLEIASTAARAVGSRSASRAAEPSEGAKLRRSKTSPSSQ